MQNNKRNTVLKSVLISTVASVALSGAVYVVPADIDNYKAKTDQSFYDMYQNSDSVIANGLNENLVGQMGNMDTSGKLASGSVINRVGQASVAGSPVKGGTSGGFTLEGKKYNVYIDKKGVSSLSGYKADGKGRISLKGNDAVKPSGASCTSSGKYGCTAYSRNASEVYFDLPTGTLTTSLVSQARNYSCGKYGCNPTNSWHSTNLLKLNKQQLGVLDILNNREILSRNFKITPLAVNSSNNGKYDN